MNIWDIIIISLIIIAVGFAVASVVNNRRKGKGCCNCNCSNCKKNCK